ncbi:MAG: hypothetical protein M1819_006676 [Sarea resinae]|nr:MAG: hypothetical protein M1819_006676 [Sarea resinae]
MARVILAINVGSSSVKVSVYKAAQKGAPPKHLLEAQVAGLTAPPATLTYQRGETNIKSQKIEHDIKSQEDAFTYLLDYMTNDKDLPDVSHRDDINYACHRVVHGGDFPDAQIISKPTYHYIEQLSDLAPLHNGGALTVIHTCIKELPKTENVAYFDSSFHTTLPKEIRTYPIDPEISSRNKLRKYGFHGISYSFITRSVAEFLQKPIEKTNIIALHLGSGASICAVKDGKSFDTSMGLTPLAGLPGATRSGSIDPSLVFHYTHKAGRLSPSSTKQMHISTAEEILNKESGWKSLTGTTDFGHISSHAEDSACALAFDIFVDRILGYIGSYYIKLSGDVDALVFAGGIGEKGSRLRQSIIDQCKCLGFEIDQKTNEKPGDGVVTELTGEKSRYRTLICKTDEQFEMARGCARDDRIWVD